MTAIINPNTGEPFGKQRLTPDVPCRIHFYTEGDGVICAFTVETPNGLVTINAPGSTMSEAAARAAFAAFSPRAPRTREPEKES